MQPHRLITMGQVRGEFALAFKTFGNVFDCDHDSGDRPAITQRRDRDALLHFLEMRSACNGSARNEVMMKSGRQHFHYTIIQRSLETFQQTSLLEIGKQRGQGLTRSSFLADACEPRQRGVPNLNS